MRSKSFDFYWSLVELKRLKWGYAWMTEPILMDFLVLFSVCWRGCLFKCSEVIMIECWNWTEDKVICRRGPMHEWFKCRKVIVLEFFTLPDIYVLFPDLLSESGVRHQCRDWNTTVNKTTDKATFSHSFCIFAYNIK